MRHTIAAVVVLIATFILGAIISTPGTNQTIHDLSNTNRELSLENLRLQAEIDTCRDGE